MARDSILNDAQKTNNSQDTPEDTETEGQTDDDGRVKLTQRMSPDLVAEVERVQEKYELPSRNAAINFIVRSGVEEL